MSLDASGTVAGAIVFSKWKGRSYVRRHAIPANPQSGLQVGIRAMMRFLAPLWTSMPITNTTWIPLAETDRISPFNAYIRYNMQRWRQYKPPTDAYPADEGGTPPSAPTTTVTNGVHSITLTITQGSNPSDIFVIHRGNSGFTPSLSNVIAILPNENPAVYVDHPLNAGIYYYRVRGALFTPAHGTWGALEAEVSGSAS